MNWTEQQEYKEAVLQINVLEEYLQYHKAIKQRCELTMQEERTTQVLDYLKRYASEVVYPLIEQSKKAKEESKRRMEQLSKTKEQNRKLKNGLKEYYYNKLFPDPDILIDGGKRVIVTLWKRLPEDLEVNG